MGGLWVGNGGCRGLPTLEELALTRKVDGAYGRGRDPSHLGGWHWAMGGQREELQGRWQFPMGWERLSAASRGPLPEKENSVLGKDLSSAPSPQLINQ